MSTNGNNTTVIQLLFEVIWKIEKKLFKSDVLPFQC